MKTPLLLFVLLINASSFAAELVLTCGDKTVTINESSLRMKIQYPKGGDVDLEEGYANKQVRLYYGVKAQIYSIDSIFSLSKNVKQGSPYQLDSPTERLVCHEDDIL